MSQGKGKINLYDIAALNAKYQVLSKTPLSFFNHVTQWYSETFATPLHVVQNGTQVLWADVVNSYYEYHANRQSYNDVFDDVYSNLFADEISDVDEEYMRKLEEQQAHQLKLKELAKSLKSQTKPQKEESSNRSVSSVIPSTSEPQNEVIFHKTYDDTPPEDL